jgi:hypothetical protein
MLFCHTLPTRLLKSKFISLFDLTLTIPNPLSPVKLILLPEVIAILSPHANSRRTVLFNPSKHGHMKKGRVRLLKNVSRTGLSTLSHTHIKKSTYIHK